MGDFIEIHDVVGQPGEAMFCTTSSGRAKVRHLLCNRCCLFQEQQSLLIYAEVSLYDYTWWMGFKECWSYDVSHELHQQFLKGKGKGRSKAVPASNAPPAPPPGRPDADRTPVPAPPPLPAPGQPGPAETAPLRIMDAPPSSLASPPAWPAWSEEELRLATLHLESLREEANRGRLPAQPPLPEPAPPGPPGPQPTRPPPIPHQPDANPSLMELFNRQCDRITAMEDKLQAVMQMQDMLMRTLERVESRVGAVGPLDAALAAVAPSVPGSQEDLHP